jgi:endothelin-converting enzyme/putative endopeptidase
MRISRFAVILLLSASSFGLAHSEPAQQAKPKYGNWGVDYATMDRKTKPGDDFFGYAEGSWLKNAPDPGGPVAGGL